ncbi:GlsB/YeaQ/YmgE family stress response membrane protein [Bacillus amyloliquefaciens]|uniref:GlsB/YeaQ/YmgE family stress response membrane protein n=1 Tax=Bacillus TaxID=1386 RepID=UPI001F4C7CF9|nr:MULTISPECIES: GlsB/YeaQ/YmgE family stress response membrane protein [Bacillus amyloliquefaciens group]MCM3448563.1 GlsB/YeaQ/YmgE family stress response membrane protein [Bacillus velezensis]MEC2238488.1 GlsB/YeaQ/YmgE family stress response membrane protein [Bacillus velezensis]MED3229109.1 GlsB/YeaQ/YmgE family stress response membrane protein [Bacillus velezensis]MED4627508.1 GlsB/YeaQ/YmgE family stress response membrane protein [Bacillus velezensis]UNE52932.1 GlsB/YeaQ/YmgE family str
MGFIVSLIVAIIIGWIGSLFVKGSMPGGIIGSMIAGLIGAWIGHGLLGTWGPQLAGFAIIPAIIGAAIVVFLFSLIARSRG